MPPTSRRGSSKRRLQRVEDTAVLYEKRMVLYIRASTDDQKLTLDGQEHEARRWAEANGFEIAAVFIEPGVSGGKPFLERKVAREAVKHMKANAITTLLVLTLDRAFRSTADMATTLDSLIDDGLNFRMVSPDIDIRGPIGRLIANLLGAIAEFELGCRSERQARGFNAMRRQQKARCQHASYGWDLGDALPETSHSGRPTRLLVPNEKEQEVLREILRRYEERETLQAIADDLNTRGIPTKRAGQTAIRKGKSYTISGLWKPQTVQSVIEHAELAAA